MADRKLSVVFAANVDGFIANVGKASSPLKALENQVKSAAKSFMSMPNMLAGALAGGSVVALVKSQMNALESLGDTAEKLGMSTQSLAAWNSVAKQSGVDISIMQQAFSDVQTAVGGAAGGMGKTQAIFKGLNLDVKQLAALSPDQQFLKIVSALKQLDYSQQRFVSSKLFGDSNDMNKFVNMGSDELNKLHSQASAKGGPSKQDTQDAENANRALEQIGGAVKKFAGQIAIEISPAITALAEQVKAFTDTTVGGFGKANTSGSALHTTWVVILGTAQIFFGACQIGWAALNFVMWTAVGTLEIFTRGVAYAAKGLAWLMPPSSLKTRLLEDADAAMTFANALGESRKQYQDRINSSAKSGWSNMVSGESWSDKQTQGRDTTSDKQTGGRFANFKEETEKNVASATDNVNKLLDKLQFDVRTVGMSETSKELLKLKEATGAVNDEVSKQQSLILLNKQMAELQAAGMGNSDVMRQLRAEVDKLNSSENALSKINLAEQLLKQKEAMEGIASATKSLNDIIAKQQTDIKYFGYNDKQKAILEQRDNGGDPGKAQEAWRGQQRLDQLEKQKKQQEETRKKLWGIGEDTYKSQLGPVDAYKKKLEEINTLKANRESLIAQGFDPAMLSDSALGKAKQNADKEYTKSLDPGKMKTPAAALQGSKEAYSAVLNYKLGAEKDRNIEYARKAAEQAVQQTPILQQILDVLKENKPQEVSL